MDYWLWCFTLLRLIMDFHRVSCLFVTDLNVPEIVDFRDNVTLSCTYDMAGHTLNSVKWYKDKMEFFRYSPMMVPVYMKFPVAGVQVHDGFYYCNELTCRVKITLPGAKSTGVYKCEVSGDAPHFQLAAKAANMTVEALPQSDPLINNFNPMYNMEESVSATCTSDFSSLPTKLSWYINGDPALLGELQANMDTLHAHDYILRRYHLQVHFYLTGPRFYHNGKLLQLKCVAEIENFPELKRETVLTANLIPYDNLNNQMLVFAGSVSKAQRTIAASTNAACLVLMLLLVAGWRCL